jgi:hypothetical protein
LNSRSFEKITSRVRCAILDDIFMKSAKNAWTRSKYTSASRAPRSPAVVYTSKWSAAAYVQRVSAPSSSTGTPHRHNHTAASRPHNREAPLADGRGVTWVKVSIANTCQY